MAAWEGSDPAVKGAVFRWMAIILWHWDSGRGDFPPTPALAALLADARTTWWSDKCYAKIKLLSQVSSFTFEKYAIGLHDHLMVRRKKTHSRPDTGTRNEVPLGGVKVAAVPVHSEAEGVQTTTTSSNCFSDNASNVQTVTTSEANESGQLMSASVSFKDK
ncbi:hypothetical protein KC19_VG155200 [Ceratodon purpureus]|uniref:Uncharacterized protein n=1 Tax=Ceratodon purpureus TaxID=3225 RepID=A0A8T0HQX6_CERPU|nr:hypothetical protein KC19_VG155200 [Ceratodon purpureus]